MTIRFTNDSEALMTALHLVETVKQALADDDHLSQFATLELAISILSEVACKAEPEADCPECDGVANPDKVDHAEWCQHRSQAV